MAATIFSRLEALAEIANLEVFFKPIGIHLLATKVLYPDFIVGSENHLEQGIVFDVLFSFLFTLPRTVRPGRMAVPGVIWDDMVNRK